MLVRPFVGYKTITTSHPALPQPPLAARWVLVEACPARPNLYQAHRHV